MRKFRLFIRVASVLFIITTILMGVYSDEIATNGLTSLWKGGYITFLENSLNWWFVGLFIGLIQLIIENIQILNLRNSVTDKEIEVARLKSQLDQSVTTKSVELQPGNKVPLAIIIAFLIYLICTVLIDVFLNDLLNIGVYTFFRFLITWGIVGLVIVTLRLFFDVRQVFSLKRKLRKMDQEVLNLKASLFDKGSENPVKEIETTSDSEESKDSSEQD